MIGGRGLETRQHGFIEHAPELGRHAGQREQERPVLLDDGPQGGAPFVGHGLGALRKMRHLQEARVGLGGVERTQFVPEGGTLAHPGLPFRLHDHRHPEGGGESVHGAVVVGGPKPARRDDVVGIHVQEASDRVADVVQRIRADLHALQPDTQRAKASGQPMRVGVLGVARQDLVTDHQEKGALHAAVCPRFRSHVASTMRPNESRMSVARPQSTPPTSKAKTTASAVRPSPPT